MTSPDGPGPEPNPQTGPAPAPPPYAPPGYPPPNVPPGYPTYAPPGYGYPAYAPPGYGFPGYGPPEHPQTNLAFALGLIGGPGALLTCGLSLLAAPFAWYYAVVVRRAVAAAPGRYSPDSAKVTAGLVLGIIGTVLLTLAVLALTVVIVLAIADPTIFDDSSTTTV